MSEPPAGSRDHFIADVAVRLHKLEKWSNDVADAVRAASADVSDLRAEMGALQQAAERVNYSANTRVDEFIGLHRRLDGRLNDWSKRVDELQRIAGLRETAEGETSDFSELAARVKRLDEIVRRHDTVYDAIRGLRGLFIAGCVLAAFVWIYVRL